ncbi:hypothetical protein [Brevundimonas sp.]|uniref:hypothetical protein n=1 Tax=Brevundimonas sp. TaxID=1871086 RepID=UPI0035AF6131
MMRSIGRFVVAWAGAAALVTVGACDDLPWWGGAGLVFVGLMLLRWWAQDELKSS